MSKEVLDIVNRASFNVVFDTEPEAFAARENMAKLFDAAIKPALEQALAGFDRDPEKVYEIDKLAIDLGDIEFDLNNSSVADYQQLYNKVYKTTVARLVTLHLDPVITDISTDTVMHSRDLNTNFVSAYFDFLESGLLSWKLSALSLAEIEDTLISFDLNTQSIFITQLFNTINQHVCKQRFIYQHSNNFFNWIIDQSQPKLRALAAELFLNQKSVPNKDGTKIIILDCCCSLRETQSEAKLLKTLEKRVSEFYANNTIAPSIPLSSNVQVAEWQKQQHTIDDPLAKHDNEGETLYVDNGGIILCHPFLVTFFERLGLLDQKQQFNDKTATIKAMFLLHYLSAGEGTTKQELESTQNVWTEGVRLELAEHKAVLFKILCDWDLHQPIPKFQTLSRHEIEEAKQLLQSMISHWKALKNTSIEGLRETFLQRQARLYKKNGVWYLRVEQKAYDILLEHLPWSLSMLQLPWLKQKLQVEWA